MKFLKQLLLIILCIALGVGGTLVVMNFDTIKGFFNKTETKEEIQKDNEEVLEVNTGLLIA